MLSIFVTGHRGLLGFTLVRVLREAGFMVHVFDGDITDKASLQTFAASLDSLDVIVHTAAATDVNRCEQEQEWCQNVNVGGTRNVRDVAALCGARLIFTSTVSVFSGMEGRYHEEDLLDPRNVYNVTKALGEKIVLEYEKGLVLRLNLIGIHPQGSRGKNFMEWLFDSANDHKDIQLFTDIRINPLSHWTIAELIRDLIQAWPRSRILHLGSRTVLSKADIGRLVLAHFPAYRGTAKFINSDELSSKAFRPKEMWLNVDQAERELNRHFPTLEEEVSRILNLIS